MRGRRRRHLGRKDAVKYRVVTSASGFPALMSGEVDLLPRANARTLSRDTEYGVRYVETTFHEGQGFLVRRGYAVASVLELSGASVCVMAPSGAAQGLETYFQSRNMRYSVMASEQWADAVKAYADGACTLLAGDITALAAARSRFTTPTDHVILPELITKDKLGPVVRTGDEQWFSIVRWTVEALRRRGGTRYLRNRTSTCCAHPPTLMSAVSSVSKPTSAAAWGSTATGAIR